MIKHTINSCGSRITSNVTRKPIRPFSNSAMMFTPDQSSLPNTTVPPFSESTDETRDFLASLLLRDAGAIEQLNRTIQVNNNRIRDLYQDRDSVASNVQEIERLMNMSAEDIAVRNRYQHSADLLTALYEGNVPPTNNNEVFYNLRDDLANYENVGLEGLREYVQQVINTTITPQFMQEFEYQMANHRAGLSEFESRDNSQYSDEISESDSDISDDYHSATTHIDHSDSGSDSDPDDNPPSTGQGLNLGNNESDENNERNSEVDPSNDNQESKESSDNNESNVNSDKNLTEDVLDISDTLHMFFDEPSEKNKSTIDFVLQKQQEEMPDIIDSDGGE
jgi:hypothetical protein